MRFHTMRRMKLYVTLVAALLLLPAAASAAPKKAKKEKGAAITLPKTPQGLTPWVDTAPKDNPVTPEKWALGQMLFWDTRLSPAGTHSCETCHHPDKGWTDGLQFSKTAAGKVNTRHSPTLYNVAYNTSYYWDGRAPTLEKQIAAAWDGQMGAKDKRAEVIQKLMERPGYKEAFKKAFNTESPTDTMVIQSIATFVRSILSGGSRWDKFDAGDKKALSASAQKGWELFRSKAKCGTCHAGFAFTDWQFHNIGIGGNGATPDPGRGKTASDAKLTGAFKTPTLRSVFKHAPYTHLGNVKTVEEMVAHFTKLADNPHLDPNLKEGSKVGIELSKQEEKELVDFLKSLDGHDDPLVTRKPKLP
jgi:cytochrome c peroxidase